jgi:hypothetical protein
MKRRAFPRTSPKGIGRPSRINKGKEDGLQEARKEWGIKVDLRKRKFRSWFGTTTTWMTICRRDTSHWNVITRINVVPLRVNWRHYNGRWKQRDRAWRIMWHGGATLAAEGNRRRRKQVNLNQYVGVNTSMNPSISKNPSVSINPSKSQVSTPIRITNSMITQMLVQERLAANESNIVESKVKISPDGAGRNLANKQTTLGLHYWNVAPRRRCTNWHLISRRTS